MTKKARRPRREYAKEFKAEAVALVRSSDKTVAQIARDLDLTRTALERWVKESEERVAGATPIDADERAELERLRSEVRELRMERDFLKKAAAFFAKESK